MRNEIKVCDISDDYLLYSEFLNVTLCEKCLICVVDCIISMAVMTDFLTLHLPPLLLMHATVVSYSSINNDYRISPITV